AQPTGPGIGPPRRLLEAGAGSARVGPGLSEPRRRPAAPELRRPAVVHPSFASGGAAAVPLRAAALAPLRAALALLRPRPLGAARGPAALGAVRPVALVAELLESPLRTALTR